MKQEDNKEFNAAYDLIHQNSIKIPDKIAFIDDDQTINYSNLSKKVKSFSNQIFKLGLKEKDRIIICMFDCINFPITFLGSIWSNIIPICVNTMLPKQDLEYMLRDSQAKAVICSKDLLEVFIEIKNSLDNEILIISEEGEKVTTNNNKVYDLSFLINSNEYNLNPSQTFESSECFWLYSSGSTGKPKGTIHIHKSLKNTSTYYAKKILKITSEDIFFSAAKLFFAYGLGNALTFPLSIGGTSILSKDRPTVEIVNNKIKHNNVTIFFGVPTLYAAMLNSNLKPEDFKSLRLSVSAGEALPEHLCNKWSKTIGSNVLDGIGSTEMLHIFISNYIDLITPGSSGKPVPGYEVRLIKEDNSEADMNEIGELEVKGPTSAISYWNKPEKTKATFIGDWVKTGDKYTKDANGIYKYCGRSDDMMKVSGQYVSPFEIEEALQSHKYVLEAAVVGKKDKDELLKPKAFVVLNDNNNETNLEKELTAHVKKILTPFKYPRWYEFVTSLPKTATGKIQRYKLRIEK